MSSIHSVPCFEALRLLFGSSEAKGSIILLDYRSRETFTSLWLQSLNTGKITISEQEIDLTDGSKQILIVGNEPPDGVFGKIPACFCGINLTGHFTATSWLAAWKVKFSPNDEEKNKGAVEGFAKITVIDPRDLNLAQGAVRPLQTILGARDITGNSLVPGATVLNAPSLTSICECLQESNADEWTLAKDAPHLRDLLKSTIWNELTSDREQHHALSNVLGAFLLSIQVGKGEEHPGNPWVQDHLLSLVQAIGIEASLNQVKLKEHGGFQHWITPAQQKAIEGVVLIDDMADLWAYFLRGATGFAGGALFDQGSQRTCQESLEVFGKDGFAEKIAALPSLLKTFVASGQLHLSASDILGTPSKLRENFVLFLDLRLFPADSMGIPGEAEVGFFKQLQDFGNILLASKRNLPWASAEERADLMKELAHWAEQKAPKQSLNIPPRETLLPRLIALLDPTMPIVVFSSTHRTELIEPFRSYGNIITDFHKPVVSGMPGDWPQMVREMHTSFLAALNRATRIMRVRRASQGFQRKTLPSNRTRALPPGEHGHLIEVFLDESEEPTQKIPPRAVCAGGLVVIRTLHANGTPIISDEAIFKHLENESSLWGWCSDTPNGFVVSKNTPQQRGFMPKGADLNFIGNGQGLALLEKMVVSIQAALSDAGSIFPIAAVCNRERQFPDWMENPAGVSSWTVEKVFDATLRRLVQHLLESMVFRSDLLRSALWHKRSSFAIDLGIRDYPCQPSFPLYETFGLEIRNGWRPSFNSEDGFLITGETMARSGIPWPYPSKIVRARAVPLKDFGGNPARPRVMLPKQLHYFADAISHVALNDLNAATRGSEAVRKFFESGWITDFRCDREEFKRLEIGRAWDQGDRIPALLCAGQLRNGCPSNGIGIDVFRELCEGVERLGGEELKRLFTELE